MKVLDKQGDRGASAVLVALTLLVLMGFAALAVDSGALFSDRRQQQSAADGGALAALQFAKTSLSSSTCTGSGAAYAACRGAEEAIAVVNGTYPGTYDAAAWLGCSDPGAFAVASSLSPCITFTSNFQESRVYLPGADIDTSFAGLLGADTVEVAALAEARFDLNTSAKIRPWAVGPTAAGQEYTCLMANSASVFNVPPCNGPVQGNFGKLDLSLYSNSTMGTPRICGNAMGNTKMAVNLITGSDHPMELATDSPGTVNDFANCPIITNPVDQLQTQTGNASGAIENGFFRSVTVTTPNYEGNLRCKDGDAGEFANDVSNACVTVGNQFPETVDHTPLWDFIAAGASAELPGPGTQCSGVDTQPEMEACLAAWNAYGTHTIALFTSGIQFAPRFGAVPILDSDPSNGSGAYDIIDFRPIYTDSVYLGCNAFRCDIVHSPGIPSPGNCPPVLTAAEKSCGWTQNGNKNVYAVTSYMLEVDMLPLAMQETFPNSPGTIVFNLSR